MVDITQQTDVDEPYSTYQYKVEINNKTVAGFEKLHGLEMQNDVRTYQEGGVNDRVHVFPGTLSYSNITLRGLLCENKDFFNWIANATTEPGDDVAKRILIALVDGDTEAWQWVFYGAQPVKWEGPVLNAEQSEIALKSVEFAYERVEAIG